MPTNNIRVGSPSVSESTRQTWVQTERASHEAWAILVRTKPRAASLLHTIVAHMDHQAALVVSRATLASMENCSEATIKRAVADLRAGHWVEVVQLGGKGGVNAYVVNSRVAWADKRDRLPGAIFTATVMASIDEQEQGVETTPLRRIPTLYPGERQLPSGAGEPPPIQDELPGVESDPPALRMVERIETPEETDSKKLRNI